MSNITLKKSLSKISFCNKECFNINNNHTKESIINHIQEKYKLQIINKQYVLINPHMIRNISYHEHLLSTFTTFKKTFFDINLSFLFLSSVPGKSPVSIKI